MGLRAVLVSLGKAFGSGNQWWPAGNHDARSLALLFGLCDVPAVGKENGSFLRDGHRPGTAGKTAEITHSRGMINQESVEPSLQETSLQPLQTAVMIQPLHANSTCQRPI